MFCPLYTFFAQEYIEYIQFMLYAYDEIKINTLKDEVERLRNEMPETIQKTQFYLLAYDNKFDEENTDPNDWVLLHTHIPEMGQNENRIKKYKKIFIRVDELNHFDICFLTFCFRFNFSFRFFCFSFLLNEFNTSSSCFRRPYEYLYLLCISKAIFLNSRVFSL